MTARASRPRAHLGLVLSVGRAYPREIFRGVAEYIRRHEPPWEERHHGIRTSTWEEVAASKPDALIAHFYEEREVRLIQRLRIAAVNVSNHLPSLGEHRVVSDDHAVGRLAADYFAGRGFRRFAVAASSPAQYATEREAGFRERLAQIGADLDHPEEGVEPQGREPRGGVAWLASLRRPCALFAVTDRMAASIISELISLGIGVPDEIAVLGVDDDEVAGAMSPIPLSSIRLRGGEVGYEAARMADALMGRGTPPPLEVRIPPAGVASRRSTDGLGVNDPALALALKVLIERAFTPIDVPDIAREAGMSRRILERRFREQLGRSPYEEILRRRMERARQLLGTSDWPVGRIAEACGFTEAKTFTTLFTRREGVCPRDFRRRERGADRAAWFGP